MSTKNKPKQKPAPKPDDAMGIDKDRPIPFGEKADDRTSSRKEKNEKKAWEEAEPEVLDDRTPG